MARSTVNNTSLTERILCPWSPTTIVTGPVVGSPSIRTIILDVGGVVAVWLFPAENAHSVTASDRKSHVIRLNWLELMAELKRGFSEIIVSSSFGRAIRAGLGALGYRNRDSCSMLTWMTWMTGCSSGPETPYGAISCSWIDKSRSRKERGELGVEDNALLSMLYMEFPGIIH